MGFKCQGQKSNSQNLSNNKMNARNENFQQINQSINACYNLTHHNLKY